MSGLEIKDVTKKFGDTVAVDAVTLDIAAGELFFLLGPSGCGKTTLLRMIAGFTAPDSGGIRFDGADLLAVPVEKRSIGMVFQNYSLWPHMTVFDNVAYGLKMRHAGRDEIRRRVGDALAMVDLTGLEARKPAALSGGQQQRVALARALVYEPRLLLLDEPLSNLDAKLRKDMRSEIRSLHKRLGITMVYVTHDQEEAASMADRIALMHRGRIVQTGTPRQIYHAPACRFAADFFGRANILSGIVRKITGTTAEIAIGGHTITAGVSAAAPPAVGTAVAAVIRPENISFASGSGGSNVLAGRCVAHEFNGAVQNYTVDIGGMRLALMTVGQAAGCSNGEHVMVSFDPSSVHLISENGQI